MMTTKNLMYDEFILGVLNDPTSPNMALVNHLAQVAPVLASELMSSSVNPQEDPSQFAAALQWVKSYWPEKGIPRKAEQDTNERMGRAITVILAEQRRSFRWLHETTGISYPYIMEITKGHKRARLDKYQKIAQALGVTLAQLMERAEALPELPKEG